MFGLEDLREYFSCCGEDYEEPPHHYDNKFFHAQDLPWSLMCAKIPLAVSWGKTDKEPIGLSFATLQDKLSVLEDWGTALSADHDNGIVHGNLTPESVGVVHRRGILIDQGWARNCVASIAKVDADDQVYNARWAAPELFRLDNGNPDPTQMSDVYSFGCLMLQILTGRVPYCGTKRPEQVVYLKYLGREPIDTQTPRVPDRYVTFMRWCWSLEPERRPTMEAVVAFIREEIKRLRQQRG